MERIYDEHSYTFLFSELDAIYHNAAQKYGLSDTSYYIFYVVRLSCNVYTQAMLCEKLHLSKQTVSSAVKALEKSGYIYLNQNPANKKSKNIYLTKEGIKLAQMSIDKISDIEKNVFSTLTENEKKYYFR